MKGSILLACVVAAFSTLTTTVETYGTLGHLLCAQVAQDYLSIESKKAIADILPPYTAGKIESIASWADTVKGGRYRWSSSLHYINPPQDFPPTRCDFEWHLGHRDIISAIYNYTARLGDERLPKDQREEALKFLVHFYGDLHNPLHVTGRSRGGNDAPAIFDRKKTVLHRIWDSQILGKQSAAMETSYLSHLLNLTRTTFLPNIASWIKCPPPNLPGHILLTSLNAGNPIPTCPDAWAAQINVLNCEYVWRGYEPGLDLAEGDYWQRLVDNLVEEKLLAMAGIRMAAVLNGVFGASEKDLKIQFEVEGGGLFAWVETIKNLVVQG